MNDNTENIIRLAEAMGMTAPYVVFRDELQTEIRAWNPYTDANDDYAVLEWMRDEGKGRWDAFSNALAVELDNDHFNYTVGCYARAALKVIDRE